MTTEGEEYPSLKLNLPRAREAAEDARMAEAVIRSLADSNCKDVRGLVSAVRGASPSRQLSLAAINDFTAGSSYPLRFYAVPYKVLYRTLRTALHVGAKALKPLLLELDANDPGKELVLMSLQLSAVTFDVEAAAKLEVKDEDRKITLLSSRELLAWMRDDAPEPWLLS